MRYVGCDCGWAQSILLLLLGMVKLGLGNVHVGRGRSEAGEEGGIEFIMWCEADGVRVGHVSQESRGSARLEQRTWDLWG